MAGQEVSRAGGQRGTAGRARRVKAGTLAAVLLAAAALVSGCHPAVATRPNILLITLDTTRADHLGAYGDRRARTPNLDRPARSVRAAAAVPRGLRRSPLRRRDRLRRRGDRNAARTAAAARRRSIDARRGCRRSWGKPRRARRGDARALRLRLRRADPDDP